MSATPDPGTNPTIYQLYIDSHWERAYGLIMPPENGNPVPTILVAEDEEAIREMVGSVLSDAGYRVILAASGRDAVNAAKNHKGPIHLLFADVTMPDFGGVEIAAKLASQYPGMKVLFTSGNSMENIITEGILGPGHEFIAKPFNLKDMLGKVKAILSGPG